MKTSDSGIGNVKELIAAFDSIKASFPAYENRPQQMEMASEISRCFREKNNLIVEAGTGVGKSFAYLIPAVFSDRKTIISTASIALQEQLAGKDLVFLQKALPKKFSFAVLKGKNNYLCNKRFREYNENTDVFRKFSEWAVDTGTGEKDELDFIPDFWPRVCGESDDCSSSHCPFYEACFYYSHYKGLRKSDIIVVNHHLLIYDLLSGFSLLPFHSQLVIDEAHQLENVISGVMGSVLSNSKVQWLLYRLRGLKLAVDNLFLPVEQFFGNHEPRGKALHPIPDEILEDLKKLKGLLALDKVERRLEAYKENAPEDEILDRIGTTINCINSLGDVIDDFLEQKDGERVYYAMWNKRYLELRSSLVEARKAFSALRSGYDSIVMTSATLTAAGSFGYIKERLDIEGFREMTVGSPFDYGKQTLIYIENSLPPPAAENSHIFFERSLKTIESLIEASRGRALVLFTSYRHLKYAADNIKTGYSFKSQGDMPPAKLIKWFKKNSGSILLATATFWQGIDVKGEKLSLVVIVKMPFGVPGDPVYDERCRRLGDRWFRTLALPSAILMLKQGFGRLIRSAEDYGVVAILDPRLVNSTYGPAIVSSLPEARIAHSVDEVKKFFDSVPGDGLI
jgi:ATP-dependent DNA helicase DinG